MFEIEVKVWEGLRTDGGGGALDQQDAYHGLHLVTFHPSTVPTWLAPVVACERVATFARGRPYALPTVDATASLFRGGAGAAGADAASAVGQVFTALAGSPAIFLDDPGFLLKSTTATTATVLAGITSLARRCGDTYVAIAWDPASSPDSTRQLLLSLSQLAHLWMELNPLPSGHANDVTGTLSVKATPRTHEYSAHTGATLLPGTYKYKVDRDGTKVYV